MFRHKVIRPEVTFDGLPSTELPPEKQIEVTDEDEIAKPTPKTQPVPREPYLADEALIDVVRLAMALGRPLLLQGDPGCGKTRLAYAVAYELGLPLEIAYIKSTSVAEELLYTYDAVSRLYDVQMLTKEPTKEAREQLDYKNYIRMGPLGRAIARAQYGRRSVVLIDEIDKADLDFPNDLLWELDQLEFSVEGALRSTSALIHYRADPKFRPIVIITHNEEKALPTAFLRRCIFHYVEFPKDPKRLADILTEQQLGSTGLASRAIDILLKLRALDLSKKPGLSELLDWVGYLEAVNTKETELGKLPMIGALLKQRIDQQRARSDFKP